MLFKSFDSLYKGKEILSEIGSFWQQTCVHTAYHVGVELAFGRTNEMK